MKSVYTGGEKVAEFESYDELRVGDSKPAFIYEGNELVYPNPVKDGLVLWYDFSGRSNADGQRGIAEDLSGNGNHGTLQNFNFTPESGYDKNKLLFDGVDDFVEVPNTQSISSFSLFMYLSPNIDNNLPLTQFSNSNTYFNVESSGKLLFFAQSNDGENNYFNGVRSLGYYDTNKKIISVGVVVDKSSIILYADGIEIGRGNLKSDIVPTFLTGLGKWNKSYPKVEINSVHFYNRPLTPEEIAHNYAIEKERFGIE